jgi:hypothetical protein
VIPALRQHHEWGRHAAILLASVAPFFFPVVMDDSGLLTGVIQAISS